MPALTSRVAMLLMAGACTVAARAHDRSDKPAPPAAGPVDYQPGIRIDWARRQVEADAVVNMRAGLIELFACTREARGHESVVMITGRAEHLFQALGLVGCVPGSPMRYLGPEGSGEPAWGHPLRIDVQTAGPRGPQVVPIETWLRPRGAELPLGRLNWVFAGSRPLPDGRLAADPEGTVIAVVDFPTALIALPESHPPRYAELWLDPHTEAIPPVGTPCTLVFSTGTLVLGLDDRGDPLWYDRRVPWGEMLRRLADLAGGDPAFEVALRVDPGCPAPASRRLHAVLATLGVTRPEVLTLPTREPESPPQDR